MSQLLLLFLCNFCSFFWYAGSVSNELVDCINIIGNTFERGNATLKKNIETGCLAEVPSLITKKQPTNMKFSEKVFGKKDRSFNANWYSKLPWLYYDTKCDSVYCYTCMTAQTKGNKSVSSNSEPAFMKIEFSYC